MEKILAEWKRKKEQIEFEIAQVESQLKQVEKRITETRNNVVIYIMFIAVPLVLLFIFSIWDGYFVLIAYYVLRGLMIIWIPVNLVCLIRAIIRYSRHSRQNLEWDLPRVRRWNYQRTERPEKNYQTEKQKLHWVLTRYYSYRWRMEQWKYQIDRFGEKISLEEMLSDFETMEFYERIWPAKK